MQTIYCISGLGADQRVFQKLSIRGARLVPVHWADYDKHDDLSCYAQKLSAQITDEDPVILGLSFGGMLAAEIARLRPVKQLFLVSSAKDATELPHMGGLARFVINRKLIPVGLSRIAMQPIYEQFGTKTPEEKALLRDILNQSDPGFTRWALKAMFNWQTRDHVNAIVHIHGTADRLISPVTVKPTHWIEGGTHFMIYQRAAEVSRIIAAGLI